MNKLKVVVTIITFIFCVSFVQTAYSQVEKAYITEFSNGSLYVVNTETNDVEARIPLVPDADGLVLNSDCTRAYVATNESNSIIVVDLISNTIIDSRTFLINEFPVDIEITPDDNTLYATGFDKVLVINAHTLDTITTVPLPASPQTIAILPDGSKVFAATETDIIFTIDTSTNTIINTENIPPPFPFDVHEFTVSPDGQTVYLTNFQANGGGRAGIIISASTNQITGDIPLQPGGANATVLGFVPDGSKAYLTDFANNFLSQYDPVGNTFTASPFVGDDAGFLAFTEDGSRSYIVRAQNITEFDTNSNSVLDNISVINPNDILLRIAICSIPPRNVPTLSEWGLVALAAAIGMVAFIILRRRISVA